MEMKEATRDLKFVPSGFINRSAGKPLSLPEEAHFVSRQTGVVQPQLGFMDEKGAGCDEAGVESGGWDFPAR